MKRNPRMTACCHPRSTSEHSANGVNKKPEDTTYSKESVCFFSPQWKKKKVIRNVKNHEQKYLIHWYTSYICIQTLSAIFKNENGLICWNDRISRAFFFLLWFGKNCFAVKIIKRWPILKNVKKAYMSAMTHTQEKKSINNMLLSKVTGKE